MSPIGSRDWTVGHHLVCSLKGLRSLWQVALYWEKWTTEQPSRAYGFAPLPGRFLLRTRIWRYELSFLFLLPCPLAMMNFDPSWTISLKKRSLSCLALAIMFYHSNRNETNLCLHWPQPKPKGNSILPICGSILGHRDKWGQILGRDNLLYRVFNFYTMR